MLSLKYKNIVKKALFEEISKEKAIKYIKHNSQEKEKILSRIAGCEKYTFWIKHVNSLTTEFYYIHNDYLDTNQKTLTFKYMEIFVHNDKTMIDVSDETSKVITLTDNEPLIISISKYFNVNHSNYDTAFMLIKGILSNIKLNQYGLQKYMNKSFLSDKGLSEEDKKDLMSSKEKFISDFDKSNFNIDDTKINDLAGTNSSMSSTTGMSVLIDPRNLIGDDKYRHPEAVKRQAEKSILTYEKSLSNINHGDDAMAEEVAAVIVYKALESVLTNPCEPFNITKDDLFGNKELKFNKELPDYNSPVEEAANKGSFNKFDTHTIGNEILKIVDVNPVEVLSPLAFVSMKIPESNWSVDGNGISSMKLVEHLFHIKENYPNILISYPLERNRMLYDSIILIPHGNKYRRINISTKGGKDGQGAAASLAGVFQYLLNSQYQTEDVDDMKNYGKYVYSYKDTAADIDKKLDAFIDKYCSDMKKIDNFYETYKMYIKVLILFGTTSSKSHESICEDVFHVNPKTFVKNMNAKGIMSKCIMNLLDRQKYDFAQVNAKPHLFGETFSYDYYVQYPAKFSGSANLEYSTAGGIKFHIVGG